MVKNIDKTKIIKRDYTSGKEIITDVSDEIIHVIFVPEIRNIIDFKIKRRHIQHLIKMLQSSFETDLFATSGKEIAVKRKTDHGI